MGMSTAAESADFDLLYEPLAGSVSSSIAQAMKAGAIFDRGQTPLEVFRFAVDDAIRDIHSHPRGDLLRRFVTIGPYERDGPIPSELETLRLTDQETAKAIGFVFSWMVNSFQGRLAELLAAATVATMLHDFKKRGSLPDSARLYVGDAVAAPRTKGNGRAKAADLHVLSRLGNEPRHVTVHVLGEIKSYSIPESRARRQLALHLARARRGLILAGESIAQSAIRFDPDPPVAIWVEPSEWKLPRGFRFEESGERTFLHVDEPPAPNQPDQVTRTPDGSWHIKLRWSHESLAAAAYALSFWYMERVGEAAFAGQSTNPWPEMSPADAGRNAATQSLYYAIIRARTEREQDRAVALYNTHGFGYALGMNFRDSHGGRQMLWPEDLREIARDGATKSGCQILP